MNRGGKPVNPQRVLASPAEELLEEDSVITQDLDEILEEDEAAMIFNATWNPEQTPRRQIPPSIGNKEDLYVEEAVRAVDSDNLKLMVNSFGGDISASYNIADMLCRGFENVETYVPKKAKSGGTLISLAGDTVVLGFNGELGPLDPQYRDEDGRMRSVNEGLRKHKSLTEEFSENSVEDMPYTKQVLAENFEGEELQRWEDMQNDMKERTHEILAYNDKLSGREAAQITDKLISGHSRHADSIKYHHLANGEEYDSIPDKMILNEDDRPEEMGVMRDWFKHYLTTKTSDHVVRFYE